MLGVKKCQGQSQSEALNSKSILVSNKFLPNILSLTFGFAGHFFSSVSTAEQCGIK